MTINLIGYHGTREEYVKEILKDGFKPAIRENHWLGQGSYFFDDKDLAIWFPVANPKHKDKNIAIIKVEIVEKSEQVLDLDKIRDLSKFYSKTLELLKKSSHKIVFEDDEHKNLCFLLDLYKKIYSISVVKFTFRVSNPYYGGNVIKEFESEFMKTGLAYNQVQICITDNSVIKSKIIEKQYDLNNKIEIEDIKFLIRKR